MIEPWMGAILAIAPAAAGLLIAVALSAAASAVQRRRRADGADNADDVNDAADAAGRDSGSADDGSADGGNERDGLSPRAQCVQGSRPSNGEIPGIGDGSQHAHCVEGVEGAQPSPLSPPTPPAFPPRSKAVTERRRTTAMTGGTRPPDRTAISRVVTAAPTTANATTDRDATDPAGEPSPNGLPYQPAAAPNQPTAPYQSAAPRQSTEPRPSPAAAPRPRWVRPAAPQITTVGTGDRAGTDRIATPGAAADHATDDALPHRRAVNERQAATSGPAVALDIVEHHGVTAAYASLRGLAHEDFGRPRQDAAGLLRVGRHIIATVADGASQARLSHIGASVVCRSATAAVRDQLRGGATPESLDWQAVTAVTRDALRRQAARLLGAPARETGASHPGPDDSTYAALLGTTAEVLVVDAEAETPTFVRATLAGDGYAFLLDADRGVLPLGTTKGDESGLETSAIRPLPADPGAGYPRIVAGTIGRGGQALMLTTDGIGDDMADGSTPTAGYLLRRLSRPVAPHELLRAASYLKFQSHDDRTVVMVWAQ